MVRLEFIKQMAYHTVRQKLVNLEQFCGHVIISIKIMMEQLLPVNEECSIFPVLKLLRKMNNIAYIPQVISIGPFHHCSQNDLIVTVKYKLRCCINFLGRLDNKMDSLEFLVKATQSWVKEARNCYTEPINMSDEDFVQMMLVDSCFVVEFLILYYVEQHRNSFPQTRDNFDLYFYQREHEIFLDLIKLENHVPFFVLERLFHLIPQNDTSISFITLTNKFLQRGIVEGYSLPDASPIKPMHFVDFLSFYFVVSLMTLKNNDNENNLLKE